jgi:hypothetical protein
LIFKFLDSKLEEKRFWTEWQHIAKLKIHYKGEKKSQTFRRLRIPLNVIITTAARKLSHSKGCWPTTENSSTSRGRWANVYVQLTRKHNFIFLSKLFFSISKQRGNPRISTQVSATPPLSRLQLITSLTNVTKSFKFMLNLH